MRKGNHKLSREIEAMRIENTMGGNGSATISEYEEEDNMEVPANTPIDRIITEDVVRETCPASTINQDDHEELAANDQ